jgi:hypothetical protein
VKNFQQILLKKMINLLISGYNSVLKQQEQNFLTLKKKISFIKIIPRKMSRYMQMINYREMTQWNPSF